ncbi:MAG: ABC transporter substrate-binding protein, partial [Deltaproteobacteria bacterium]|nr:ABC transporter substrate-binding protein [Deltaproteobacteria bacterium]
IRALREMDGLIHREHPYVLNWYGPFTRILYWNRFGMPPSYLSKMGDINDILTLWWIDPEKKRTLKDAMDNDRALPVGPVEVKYWLER